MEPLIVTEQLDFKADWLKQLPTDDIRSSYSTPSPARDPAVALVKYSKHWDGSWNGAEGCIELKPMSDSNIILNDNGKYENKMVDDSYTPITEILPNVFSNIATGADDSYMFRGVGYEAMKEIKKSGEIGSGINLKSQGQDPSRVFYATEASSAFGYAAHGACFYDMATFNQPGFVFAVKRPEGVPSNQEKEIIINNNIKLGPDIKIYMVIPVEMTAGRVPVTLIEKEGETKFLETPGIATISENAPRGKFAFKEVNMNELII